MMDAVVGEQTFVAYCSSYRIEIRTLW